MQSQHPPQIGWGVLLQCFRTLDAPQRHQQKGQQTGAQTIEGGADAAVNVFGTLEDAAITVSEAR